MYIMRRSPTYITEWKKKQDAEQCMQNDSIYVKKKIEKKTPFGKHTYINVTTWRKTENGTHQIVDSGYLWGGGTKKICFFLCICIFF